MKKAVKRVMMTTQPAKNRNTPNSMEHSIVTKLRTADNGWSGWQPARIACMRVIRKHRTPHGSAFWTHHWAIKKVNALHAGTPHVRRSTATMALTPAHRLCRCCAYATIGTYAPCSHSHSRRASQVDGDVDALPGGARLQGVDLRGHQPPQGAPRPGERGDEEAEQHDDADRHAVGQL